MDVGEQGNDSKSLTMSQRLLRVAPAYVPGTAAIILLPTELFQKPNQICCLGKAVAPAGRWVLQAETLPTRLARLSLPGTQEEDSISNRSRIGHACPPRSPSAGTNGCSGHALS